MSLNKGSIIPSSLQISSTIKKKLYKECAPGNGEPSIVLEFYLTQMLRNKNEAYSSLLQACAHNGISFITQSHLYGFLPLANQKC
jgi:hypothetical protein